jgi:hypothetical protein
MKYRDCNDGEWFWLAEDPTSFGKTFKDAQGDLIDLLEGALVDIENAIEDISSWREGETFPPQTKVVLPF